ncbi:MAG TPA: FKBP-type peptidyl-prolyl cis-trans isomerase [Arenimonas sp.]|uniref:FKBP-type peptidyl-prolyl cis-trans isomerase n=1 Tax=Arenimonas sp. TaxID=1872635 RepID=UPI002D7F3AE2|nr:FKBP-type peptidyl-prolyl cis-trans isomerase [Arenimonas sp.]HEU0152941.1 FKBP-type peptidyl-prolyl cis-trans isomerase [Arenimonas sp.]
MNSALRYAAPLVLASLVLSLSACKKPEADEATAPAAVAAEEAPAVVAGIEGQETEKKQVSYMIGLDMAKSLSPIKDSLDIEVMTEAMIAHFNGAEPKLTDEQMIEVQQAFTTKMQEQAAAKAAAAAVENLAKGAEFLAANKDKPGVQTTESGLQYEVVRAGNGDQPAATDVVKVHYKGTLLDGTVFDSSYDRGEPAEFGLNQVIPGWSEGVALMKVGSKYTFWIPAELAYGESGGGPIPPNSMLTFEVELLEIVK